MRLSPAYPFTAPPIRPEIRYLSRIPSNQNERGILIENLSDNAGKKRAKDKT
jgi:hypothetical protein